MKTIKTVMNIYNSNFVHVAKHIFNPEDAICAAVVELSNGYMLHMRNVPEALLAPADKPFDSRHVETMQ
jgi:hypothetical protein